MLETLKDVVENNRKFAERNVVRMEKARCQPQAHYFRGMINMADTVLRIIEENEKVAG